MTLTVQSSAGARDIEAEAVIAPDCREPYVEGLGLEAIGVRLAGAPLQQTSAAPRPCPACSQPAT
ncbi:MAG: hypothetical protein U0531_03265 [Dehalococcoidia bacterium]